MSNPLVNEVTTSLPGVVISLPTAGRFYDQGVLAPNTNPSAIEVRPVSIIDEINFRDPYKIVSGLAMKELIRRSCKEILIPEALCKVDIDLIMLAVRAASHGSTFETNMTCTNENVKTIQPDGTETVSACKAENNLKIDLNRVMIQFRDVGDDWSITFPNGQIVQLFPIKYSSVIEGLTEMSNQAKESRKLTLLNKDKDIDAIEETQKNAMDKIAKLQVKLMVDSIKHVISVAKVVVTDKFMIYEWLASLPPDWIGAINDLMNRKSKMMEDYLNVSYNCSVCKHHQTFPMILDPTSFFSSGSRNSTPLIRY
jgi:hypothetical protein